MLPQNINKNMAIRNPLLRTYSNTFFPEVPKIASWLMTFIPKKHGKKPGGYRVSFPQAPTAGSVGFFTSLSIHGSKDTISLTLDSGPNRCWSEERSATRSVFFGGAKGRGRLKRTGHGFEKELLQIFVG